MILIDPSDLLPEIPPDAFDGQKLSETDLRHHLSKPNEGKKPMIVFGANWCPDALFLSAVMELPSIKGFLITIAVKIDVGRYDLNMELMPVVGIPSQQGIPRHS